MKYAALEGGEKIYCRVFVCPEEGRCELGYWKEDKPQGKYQRFDVKGECVEQGIKTDDVLEKNCEIHSYQTRMIKTAKNEVGRPSDQVIAANKAKRAGAKKRQNNEESLYGADAQEVL